MSPAAADGVALAESWVEHLRGGGTTPWPRWVRKAAVQPRPEKVRAPGVPGAAQLELLRRLNALAPLPHRAEHVLNRPGPGRGPVHLRLSLEPLRPAPRREVLRVAAGVLADLTAQLPPPRRRRRRWWVRRPRPVEGVPTFVLEGPPVTVAQVRARLAAAGLHEHRPGSFPAGADPDVEPDLVVVLVAALDEALRQAWAGRVQRGAGRAWPRFVARWTGSGSLPPSVAVDRNVDYWASRVGSGNVHLVALDPTEPRGADPAARVAVLLGQQLGDAPAAEPAAEPAPDDPVRLCPAALEVLRRVNVVLPFVCPAAERDARRKALVGLLQEMDGRADPVDLPARRRSWADATAARLEAALERSGCVVHGELGPLSRTGPGTDRRLGSEEVLDAMVRMIHRIDAELVGGRRDGRGGR